MPNSPRQNTTPIETKTETKIETNTKSGTPAKSETHPKSETQAKSETHSKSEAQVKSEAQSKSETQDEGSLALINGQSQNNGQSQSSELIKLLKKYQLQSTELLTKRLNAEENYENTLDRYDTQREEFEEEYQKQISQSEESKFYEKALQFLQTCHFTETKATQASKATTVSTVSQSSSSFVDSLGQQPEFLAWKERINKIKIVPVPGLNPCFVPEEVVHAEKRCSLAWENYQTNFCNIQSLLEEVYRQYESRVERLKQLNAGFLNEFEQLSFRLYNLNHDINDIKREVAFIEWLKVHPAIDACRPVQKRLVQEIHDKLKRWNYETKDFVKAGEQLCKDSITLPDLGLAHEISTNENIRSEEQRKKLLDEIYNSNVPVSQVLPKFQQKLRTFTEVLPAFETFQRAFHEMLTTGLFANQPHKENDKMKEVNYARNIQIEHNLRSQYRDDLNLMCNGQQQLPPGFSKAEALVKVETSLVKINRAKSS